MQAPLYSRWQCLWYIYKRDERAGARGIYLMCFCPFIFLLIFLSGCVGYRECKRRSTLGGSAYNTHTSGMGELAREDVLGGAVYFSIYVTGSLIG